MEVKLTEDEIEVLKLALSEVVIQNRTGQIGILHGANRFVSMNIALKKQGRNALGSAYKKLGINSGAKEVDV